MAHTPRTTKAVAARPATPERIRSVKRTPEFEVALGARIRAARIAARMSQGALGDAVGISFQQVQKYELGRDRVAASTLQGFASALGMHPGSFYGDNMPVPAGSISDMKAAFKAANVLGQIRDPRVLKQILALAKVLGEADDREVEQPATTGDGAP